MQAHVNHWFGEQRSGANRLDAFEDLNFGDTVVLPPSSVADGIYDARALIGRAPFDEKNCKLGISRLKSYSYIYDEKTGIATRKTVHSIAGHGSDSFRYGAVHITNEYPAGTASTMWKKPRVIRAVSNRWQREHMWGVG